MGRITDMKRILCCLLVWVMLLCVLPVGALAAMQITEAEPAEQKSVAPQLPYEGACIVVDEEDLPVYTVPAPSKPAQKGADGTVPYYGRSALQKMADGEKLVNAYDALVRDCDRTLVEFGDSEIKTDLRAYGSFYQEEINLLISVVRQDHPEYFYFDDLYWIWTIGNGVVTQVGQPLLMVGDTRKNAIAAVENAADSIVSGIHAGMSEYEKALYLHDALAAHVAYVDHDNAHNIYGAFVQGLAVCDGYSEAYQYLLRKAGIQSYVITGTGNGGPHAWNYVRVDGKYYQTDVTWDDQGDSLYHAYFNLTDARMGEDHEIASVAYTLPVCNSTEAFYFSGKPEYMDTYSVDALATVFAAGDLQAQMYIPGDFNTFYDWLRGNIWIAASRAGILAVSGARFSFCGNEIIVRLETAYTAAVVSPDGHKAWYTTVQAAADACQDGQYVRLIGDVQENIVLSRDLYVDLRGNEFSGTLQVNGHRIYGMDTGTDGYTCLQIGNFACTAPGGMRVEPQETTRFGSGENTKRYLTVAEENGYSFHRFYAGITKVSLAPNVTGFGYKAEFYGDLAVRQQVDSVGYSLWFTEDLVANRSKTGFSTQLTLRLQNFNAEQYGQAPVNARVWVRMQDGTVLESGVIAMSLRQMVEQINGEYNRYSAAQRSAIAAMIQKHPVMGTWNTDNLY